MRQLNQLQLELLAFLWKTWGSGFIITFEMKEHTAKNTAEKLVIYEIDSTTALKVRYFLFRCWSKSYSKPIKFWKGNRIGI